MNTKIFIIGLLMLMSIGMVSAYNGDFCTETHSPCGGGCTSTDLSAMYYNYDFITDPSGVGDITGWDTSCITNMVRLFHHAVAFNQSIGSWNTSSVNNMNNMFLAATAFNQPLNSWDVSSVTNMNAMFSSAHDFNQPLNSWDVSSVTNMFEMFYGAHSFNQPIGSWDVSHVTNMRRMFAVALSFNQPLNSWNTSSVTLCYFMFNLASSFNQPLDNWDMSHCTAFDYFFSQSAFNQDISGWNTSSATSMYRMFGDTPFNQNIGGWDVSHVTNFNDMFVGATLSSSNYDALLNGWSTQTVPTGRIFNAGNSIYTSIGDPGREILEDTYGWTIIDGGEAACTEDWEPHDGICNGHTLLRYYTDENNCNTTGYLPIDNGTLVNCTSSSSPGKTRYLVDANGNIVGVAQGQNVVLNQPTTPQLSITGEGAAFDIIQWFKDLWNRWFG